MAAPDGRSGRKSAPPGPRNSGKPRCVVGSPLATTFGPTRPAKSTRRRLGLVMGTRGETHGLYAAVDAEYHRRHSTAASDLCLNCGHRAYCHAPQGHCVPENVACREGCSVLCGTPCPCGGSNPSHPVRAETPIVEQGDDREHWDGEAPSVADCLDAVRADLHPWQVDRVRGAFKSWLASWSGLNMTAEDLVDRA